MASALPKLPKPKLTINFFQKNTADLFFQETQWRGHGGIDVVRPSADPNKPDYGVFPVPDNFNIITLGVGDVGVTSCGDEGLMTMKMFRNLAKIGSTGITNLDKVGVSPGIFKSTRYDVEKKPVRICPNWNLSNDDSHAYFTGYTRTKAHGTENNSFQLLRCSSINPQGFIQFSGSGDIRVDRLDTGETTPNMYFNLETYVKSLNYGVNIITDASYPWTYVELETYAKEDLRTLLMNTLYLHFSGWDKKVTDEINSLNRTELIKKISMYGKRLVILFNCSWINKGSYSKKLQRGPEGDKDRIEVVRTIVEMRKLMQDARKLYTRHAYIIEESKRKRMKPPYDGQGVYKEVDAERFRLCVQDLSKYKVQNQSELTVPAGAPFAREAQLMAQGKPVKITPQLKRVFETHIPGIDSSSSSSRSNSSSSKRAKKRQKKTRRNEARSESFKRAPSPGFTSDEEDDNQNLYQRMKSSAMGKTLKPIKEEIGSLKLNKKPKKHKKNKKKKKLKTIPKKPKK